MTRLQITFVLLLFALMLKGQEIGALQCGDGIDNDNNGLTDCEEIACATLTGDGCAICGEGISFADIVLDYSSGCPLSDPEPEGALGVSDYDGSSIDSPTFTFLGQGGFIKLGFLNNLISNSGNDLPDLYVFEVGPAVESMEIGLRPADNNTQQVLLAQGIFDIDNDGFFEFGVISGSTSSFDIDQVIAGQNPNYLIFDAIEITDVLDSDCGNSLAPGADIDAVCSLSYIPVDCLGVVNGTAVLDGCGECLESQDPLFNQSCIDCLGVVNGTSVLDDCGVCLEPEDPMYNQSCIDCMGVINGIAVLDDCGVCLESGDLLFNQSCIDCSGVINGTAILDNCGECLEPDNPFFNQSCIDCDIFLPNVFAPSKVGENDVFKMYTCSEFNPLVEDFTIYDRWGNRVFSRKNIYLKDETCQWKGLKNNTMVSTGVYVYFIQLRLSSDKVKNLIGNVTLLKN